MQQATGKLLIAAGLIFAITGIILVLRDSVPFFRYIGKLPGDISFRKENFSIYFPLTSCILLSIFFSLIFYLIRRFR